MKIDRYLNIIFTFLFGISEKSDGRGRLYMHSQNLNEGRDGEPKGLPWEGRLWMRWDGKFLCQWSWNLWYFSCGVSVKADHEDGGTQLHVAFPPCSFWLTLPIFKKALNGRTLFDITVHNWAIWWQFGGNDFEWNSRTPKWKHGCFHIDDFFLGRTKHSEVFLETKDIMIPMPEGLYPAIAKKSISTWKRPRWFALKKTSIWVNIPQGVPHEGKGESDYNCGEDGLFGCGVDGESYEKAIANVVEKVLTSRRKYNGNRMAKYPDPAKRPPPATPPPEDCAQAAT